MGAPQCSSEVVQLQQGLVQDLVDAHVLLFGTGQTLCEYKGHPATHTDATQAYPGANRPTHTTPRTDMHTDGHFSTARASS